MAHTELDFSLPANGTTVGEPVEEISVGFTDQVALVGNGFEVHDPQGNLLTPFVVTDDDKVFRFQLDPPLAGGAVAVDYHVRALDGDVQEGSFSFTVAAPLRDSRRRGDHRYRARSTDRHDAPAATAAAATHAAGRGRIGVIDNHADDDSGARLPRRRCPATDPTTTSAR